VCNTPLIDVRPEEEFLRGHDPGAANLPVEELASRVHELPAKGHGVRVVDSDAKRAAAAEAFFAGRGTPVRIEPFDPTKQTEVGRATVRLWEPSAFLVEALNRIGQERELAGLSALDVACGTGRDAVYMARRGLTVTAVDVLPDALSRVEDLARRNGVKITTVCNDLERSDSLPNGSKADVVTVFRYLHRPLFPSLASAINPGGYIIYETFHERNREAGKKPCSPAHLLREGELARLYSGFELLIFRDAWERDGRWFSSLLARKGV
jgi:SAM-dependent methyltransferase